MKNKGFTMVELMVSIAIIAVVMVFLVRLLVDIKYDFTNELYNTSNQINRAEIIKTIQEDWLDKELYSINPQDDTFAFYYNDKSIVLVSSETDIYSVISFESDGDDQYIKYLSTSGKKYKWKVEKNNKETYLKTTDIPYKVIKNLNNNTNANITNDYIVELNIPVIIDKSELRETNDSRMDNIILTFYGSNENDIADNGTLN